MNIKAGDKIKLPDYICGWRQNTWSTFEVVEFRNCLGIFHSNEAREALEFTPLCELYEPGPDSEEKYISNYGNYISNLVPAFILLAEK